MEKENVRKIAQQMFEEGKSYSEISQKFNVSENTAIYQIGSNVKEVQFQIKLMCGNQMKYAHIMFDEYGIRIINEW